jgi:hypothetical protein
MVHGWIVKLIDTSNAERGHALVYPSSGLAAPCSAGEPTPVAVQPPPAACGREMRPGHAINSNGPPAPVLKAVVAVVVRKNARQKGHIPLQGSRMERRRPAGATRADTNTEPERGLLAVSTSCVLLMWASYDA